ncbi:hypothetical protein EDC96DRAFT_138157 [Choanephora cucurbitarum]|nr:hypothetical protein EDC96DRAFT_138157 [Choanephora cucurbitarum]
MKALELTLDMLHVKEPTQDSFLDKNRLLSDTLTAQLDHWQHLFRDNQDEEDDLSWQKAYKTTEFDLIDLNAQIQGYQARLRQLRSDEAKINNLPKVLAILQSETEQYAKEMQYTSKQLEQFEKDSIRPCLQQLIETETASREQKAIEQELTRIECLLKEMQQLYVVVTKQRACQQLALYLDNMASGNGLQLGILKAIEKELKVPNSPPCLDKDNNPSLISDIQQLLGQQDPVEQIKTLRQQEKDLKQAWMDQMANYMTTAQAL